MSQIPLETSWLELGNRLLNPMAFGQLAEFRKTIADGRDASHQDEQGRDSGTVRRWTPDSSIKGVTGEVAFCLSFGLDVAATVRADIPEGDRGIDWRIHDVTGDVKTSADPTRLLAESRDGKQPIRAEVVVFAHYQGKWDRDRAVLIGWCTREELYAAPIIDTQYGRRHCLLAHELRDYGDIALNGLRRFLDAAPPK
jgi:hypothetical protein